MAGLVLGALGGMAFGPAGYLIGSTVGNLLFPSGKDQEGPRLKNLRLQGSDYGKMIPIVYANFRLAGIVDFTTDLLEHKNESGGKGQGPRVTTYSYTATFSILICEGPMASVAKIWINGTTSYDATGNTPGLPDLPITIYLGTDLQMPDPSLEAILGVGNLSARRGYCYVVLTDMDLAEWGNTLPQFNFLVCQKDNLGANGQINRIAQNYDMTYQSGVPFITSWERGAETFNVGTVYDFYDYDQFFPRVGIDTPYSVQTYNADLTYVGPDPASIDRAPIPFTLCNLPPNARGIIWNYQSVGIYSTVAYGEIPLWIRTTLSDGSYPTPAGISPNSAFPMLGSSDLEAIAPGGNLSIPYPYGIEYGRLFGLDPGEFIFGAALSQDRTSLYLFTAPTFNAAMDTWYEIVDGAIVRQGDITPNVARSQLGYGNSCGRFHTTICSSMENNGQYLWLYASIYEGPVGGYTGGTAMIYEITGTTLAFSATCGTAQVGGAAGVTEGGSIQVIQTGYAGVVRGDGRLAIFTRLTGQPEYTYLYEVLNDQSARCGLQPTQRFTDNQTQIVYGYAVDQQAASRSVINQLQPIYQFDGYASDGVNIFVNRGAESMQTIPDGDLATQAPGENSLPLIGVKRQQEQDIPAEISLSYINPASDYQMAVQYARRQVTESQATARLEIPIVLPTAVAASCVWINLTAAWIERTKTEIHVPPKYLFRTPTDVITAHGYTFRITNKTKMPNRAVKLEGVVTNTQTWIGGPVGGGGGGWHPSLPPVKTPSIALLLDVPLQSDTGFQFGYYWAATSTTPGAPYAGTALFMSADAGASYNQVSVNTTADIIGTTNDALGDWLGGNFFDEVNSVTVTLGGGGGDLVSFTQLGVYNGEGLYLVGNEYVQACVATEVSDGVWRLSSLLRGRRGTEWAMGSHLAGERFVYLPVTNVDGALSELGQARLFKAVASGFTLANTTAQPFTNNGIAALPYAPSHVGGGPITPFDGVVQINWTRRTRVGGAWADFINVPVSEATEAYVVQIWDSTYSNCARIIETTTPTCTYTSAQQIADFGANQENIYCTVGQVGAYRLGTQTPAVIPGSGSGDDPVLVPIPPYNSGPPAPAACAGLPVQSSAFTWASPVVLFNAAADSSHAWVITLTTGSAVATACFVQIGTTGPAVVRTATISTTPCGAPLGALTGSTQTGPNPNLVFYMLGNPNPTLFPTLLPSTTYYITVTSSAASGASATLVHP